MAKFDTAAFIKFVWKNQRKIINSRSISSGSGAQQPIYTFTFCSLRLQGKASI